MIYQGRLNWIFPCDLYKNYPEEIVLVDCWVNKYLFWLNDIIQFFVNIACKLEGVEPQFIIKIDRIIK